MKKLPSKEASSGWGGSRGAVGTCEASLLAAKQREGFPGMLGVVLG